MCNGENQRTIYFLSQKELKMWLDQLDQGDQALRPVVPDVTKKPIQQALIEHLERKMEMIEVENKKLRKTLGSRKHI